jgi:hypothetical protein
MRHLKKGIILFFCIICLVGFAQKDSITTPSASSITVNSKHVSIHRKVFIAGGVGCSTIQVYLYGLGGGRDQPEGTGQSIVYNGTVDYGISNRITIGTCVAYQSATGTIYRDGLTGPSEFTTRLNLSARALFDILSKPNFEIYCGVRSGISYWTDKLSAEPTGGYQFQPTLGKEHTIYPSIQVPIGVRFFFGHFGLHAELAVGTPYFAEGGITFRIGKQE